MFNKTYEAIMNYVSFLRDRRDFYELKMEQTGKNCWRKRYAETCKEIEKYLDKAREAIAE